MTPDDGDLLIVELDATAFSAALPILLTIYTAAMRYAPTTGAARRPLWLDHCRRDGFRCVIAVDADEIIGFGYGYRGRAGQWWCDEVSRGVGRNGHPWLADFFELTELHVLPTWQGRGVGERVLRALLRDVDSAAVLLSTPEGENRAWRLYRRLGFRDVLRNFLFTGDMRPFAVLGRPLPLRPAPVD